jgi:hypothetical protein
MPQLCHEQESERKWWMHASLKLFVLKNFWSKDVIHGSGGNFYMLLVKKLALYMYVNEFQRLRYCGVLPPPGTE